MKTDDVTLQALAAEVGHALKSAGRMLATAESCTGGWIAKVLTDTPGSSGWFERGFITYSNESKVGMLGVRQGSLDAQGAVSEAVAREMAEGATQWSRAQVAVAVTGIAGPDGGTADKPVGMVWLAWRWADGRVTTQLCQFSGDRDSVRFQAVLTALEGLRAGV